VRPDDGDPFNAGWNAALDVALRRVKKLPTEKVAEDGLRVLVSKPDVLEILRDPQLGLND